MCDLVANEIKKALAESEVQIAQYKARAMQAEAENERLKKELEKLRAKA